MAALPLDRLPSAEAVEPALHIPDGFVSLPVATVAWVAAAAAIALAARRAERQVGERAVPLMGVMAAFIFAAQMINFPVAGGTSGHLVGGTLAAVLLGVAPAVLVMAAVVIIQALVFQDGGIAAIGANTLNLAVLAVVVGGGVTWAAAPLTRLLPAARPAAIFGAAWLSVEAAALSTTVMLDLSGTSPLDVALPAILGVHALIGVAEGLITVAAVGFVRQARPDLLPAADPLPESSVPPGVA